MRQAHMFVTVWLGILEISTGKLTPASAGHEYPMINVNAKKLPMTRATEAIAKSAIRFGIFLNAPTI